MVVAVQTYLRAKGVIPADRYLRMDHFGSSRTQERRRPCREGVKMSAQKHSAKVC